MYKIGWKIRGVIYSFIYRKSIKKTGVRFKFFGSKFFKISRNLSVGDNCWLEGVSKYKGIDYSPVVNMGSNICMSDNVHISCVKSITIGDNCLIGSKVYIGDHSHGSTKTLSADEVKIPPALRALSDIEPIHIGKNVWIGDGVVILAGAYIPDGSIIGANSVVKNKFFNSAIIAGLPAVEIKRL